MQRRWVSWSPALGALGKTSERSGRALLFNQGRLKPGLQLSVAASGGMDLEMDDMDDMDDMDERDGRMSGGGGCVGRRCLG